MFRLVKEIYIEMYQQLWDRNSFIHCRFCLAKYSFSVDTFSEQITKHYLCPIIDG